MRAFLSSNRLLADVDLKDDRITRRSVAVQHAQLCTTKRVRGIPVALELFVKRDHQWRGRAIADVPQRRDDNGHSGVQQRSRNAQRTESRLPAGSGTAGGKNDEFRRLRGELP